MTRGESTTDSITINRLRHKIIEGEFKIPPFQREFVWKPYQIIDLLDSILNDYPIGSVLLWETKEDLPSKRDVGGFILPPPKAEYPINYILDGQQRITSIFGVFNYELKYNGPDGRPNPFAIFYDLDNSKFIGVKDIIPNSKSIPLSLIFDNFKFNRHLADNGFSAEESKRATELQDIFKDYKIPTVTVKKKNKGEVGLIFERVNSTGEPLSTLDLMIAWTWGDNFHLKEKFDEIYESIEGKNFGSTKNKILLQCLSAIIKKTTKTSEILTLDPESVRLSIDKLKNSIELAIDYLSMQFHAKSENYLPKAQQLVALTYLFAQGHSLDSMQTKYVQYWFWRTSFSDRYSSSTDTKMDEDIIFIDEILIGNYAALDKYSSDVTPMSLISQPFSKSNSLVRATLLLLSKLHPKDLTNGHFIDTGSALSNYNKKEYHHIFPAAFLKKKEIKTSLINSICNFCFLPANSNKKISNSPPSEYFFTLIPPDVIESIIESNLIPSRMAIYEKDDYEDFLSERASLIYQNIKRVTNE